MAVVSMTRYEIRPAARDDAERAMHAYASYVRRELPGSSWTTYRDAEVPNRYTSLLRVDTAAADARHRAAEGTQAFLRALALLIEGELEASTYELVTSSDLAPRHRPEALARRRRRSR